MIITITSTTIIGKDHATVFNYFSDFRNDSLWRKEIIDSRIDNTDMGIGVQISQSSFLSKKVPSFTAEFTCTDYIANKKVVCETTGETKFWSKSSRWAEPLSENLTRITYRIEFDGAIVKYGLGFGLPNFIIVLYTKQTMKKYLGVLKKLLEK